MAASWGAGGWGLGAGETLARSFLGAADLDGVGHAVLGIELLQLRLEAVIHGAVVRGAVRDHENLRAALLENELCRPRPRVLIRRRVLRIEKPTDFAKTVRWRRRHHPVCVRP